MSQEQFDKFEQSMKESVALAIEVNVNGKIRNIDKKIDDYIRLDTEWKKEDKQWKDTAQPTVDFGKNAIGFGKILKILAWGAGVMLAIGGALKLIKDYLK